MISCHNDITFVIVPLGLEPVPASVGGEVPGARPPDVQHGGAEPVQRGRLAAAALRRQHRQPRAQPALAHQGQQVHLLNTNTNTVILMSGWEHAVLSIK